MQHNTTTFHDFGNPNSSFALENALEEAAIKISGFEAEVQEKDQRIKSLEDELGRAREFIKQLEASNDTLKRQLRAKEKSPIQSSSLSTTTGSNAIYLSSGTSNDGDDLAIVGKSKQEASISSSISSNKSSSGPLIQSSTLTSHNKLTPTTRLPQSSSSLSSSSTITKTTSNTAVKRGREFGVTTTSGTTTQRASEIKPVRNPALRPTISSNKSKTTAPSRPIPPIPRETGTPSSLSSTGNNSTSSGSGNSSSSSSRSSSSRSTSSIHNNYNLSEDELLAKRLQQEEFASYQSRVTNFDELISNNMGGNYSSLIPSFSGGGLRIHSNSNPLSASIQNFTGEESYEELLRLDESNIKVGVNKDLLSHLPITIFNNSQHCFEDNSCTFCMEEYQNGEQLRRLPCMHIFHKDCIDKWLEENHSCPCCKFDLNV